jgi:hypothetical protein
MEDFLRGSVRNELICNTGGTEESLNDRKEKGNLPRRSRAVCSVRVRVSCDGEQKNKGKDENLAEAQVLMADPDSGNLDNVISSLHVVIHVHR